ncbi:MAG: tryptophan--tRNA ligase [Bdellovibrionales bacterium]|nr:tryptophan--tRNA ligase [Bdellovibrionales bacterium]
MSGKRVMAGMRTTGALHIGHYFGVLKNWVHLQDSYDCFFGAMDWHALTDAYKRASEIPSFAREIVAEWVAFGIDPNRATLFVQSMVPEHLELTMIFANLTPMGWLERVPTWKDAEEELKINDAHNLGRFTYPVLQTADIAIYRGELVPVGQDQVAHLEISREIVRRFNGIYKTKVLPEPKPLLTATPAVTGTDGRKMSKSYGNVVPLIAEEKAVVKVCNKMVTDPKRVRREDPGDPEVCPVFGFHKLVSSDEDRKWVVEGCTTAGIGCGDCKARLAQNLNILMEKPREIKKELLNNPKALDSIIAEGSQKARVEAQKTLKEVRSAMGFWV